METEKDEFIFFANSIYRISTDTGENSVQQWVQSTKQIAALWIRQEYFLLKLYAAPGSPCEHRHACRRNMDSWLTQFWRSLSAFERAGCRPAEAGHSDASVPQTLADFSHRGSLQVPAARACDGQGCPAKLRPICKSQARSRTSWVL